MVVPFPFADRLAEKRRPALVMSGADVAEAGLIWITMITSVRTGAKRGDLPILDLAPTGLRRASMIRPVKFGCIDRNRVIRQIGVLAEDEARAVFDRLRSMIGPP